MRAPTSETATCSRHDALSRPVCMAVVMRFDCQRHESFKTLGTEQCLWWIVLSSERRFQNTRIQKTGRKSRVLLRWGLTLKVPWRQKWKRSIILSYAQSVMLKWQSVARMKSSIFFNVLVSHSQHCVQQIQTLTFLFPVHISQWHWVIKAVFNLYEKSGYQPLSLLPSFFLFFPWVMIYLFHFWCIFGNTLGLLIY